MATKHTDKCLEKAADDEPIFVLRAQDILAPRIVERWAHAAWSRGTPQEKVDEAFRLADRMREWQKTHQAKTPD